MSKTRIRKAENGWSYIIGDSNVKFTKPGVKSRIVPLDQVMNMTWDNIERAKHKRYFSVKPSHVVGYMKAQGMVPKTVRRFWVSWISGNYADEGCTKPPFKFWVSGQMFRNNPTLDENGEEKNDCTICAVIDSESKNDIWKLVKRHFPDYRERFIEEKPADWKPGDRFQ